MRNDVKRLLITLTVTVVSLALAFYRVDLSKVAQTFNHVNWLYLLPVSLTICLELVFRALRWRYMLQSQYTISTRSTFSALMIGYLANNLLPARLGELVRAYILRHEEGISGSFSLATIIVERVLDILIVVTCLFITLPLFSASAAMRRVTYLGCGMLVIILIILVLSVYGERRIVALAVRVVGRFSTRAADVMTGMVTNFIAGIRTLQSRLLSLVLVLSILAWAASATGLYLALSSINTPISIGGAFFTTALLGVAMMVPASPGAVGTYELFATSGLALLGVEKSRAIGLSVLLHLISYILTTGLGLISLWSYGLSLQKLRAHFTNAEASGTIAAERNRR